ncbi:MAG: hypothetical protein EOO92_06690 [Pedobacter sp.]|nr:MAG: hypothetical protein EOO92_06690 [Pedobacter sp.]
MKKTLSYFSILITIIIYSCGQTPDKVIDPNAATKADSAKMVCYIAIDGIDTAHLSLITAKDSKITGDMLINYAEKGDSNGQIAGEFRGDTLFVDYTFKIGTANKTIYKNPLAFLNKDGKLTMGVGQIETFLGRSRFVKGTPINFERGRFVFLPSECK